jgi:hypothetical protein
MAARANLRIEQGATFSADITVKDTNGDALNLTNYTAISKIAKGYTSTQTRRFLTTSIATPSNGIVTISLTADETETLEEGRYVYDVQITDASSTVTRVVEGIITISPGVS